MPALPIPQGIPGVLSVGWGGLGVAGLQVCWISPRHTWWVTNPDLHTWLSVGRDGQARGEREPSRRVKPMLRTFGPGQNIPTRFEEKRTNGNGEEEREELMSKPETLTYSIAI